MHRWLGFWLFCVSLCAAGLAPAEPPRTHTVHAGQRLGSIAKRYNVDIDALCSLNRIRRNDPLRVGQKLLIPERSGRDPKPKQPPTSVEPESPSSEPESPSSEPELASSEPAQTAPADATKPGPKLAPSLHTVQSGQRLASIAKRYNVSVDAICTATGMSRSAKLKPNQVLVIPAKDDPTGEGARRQVESGALQPKSKAESRNPPGSRARRASSKPSWKGYVKLPRKRGYVTLVGYHKSWKGYAIGPSGRVLPRARTRISSLLNASPHWPEVDTRLVKLLVQLSDTFGGRELRIISGLREKSYVRDSKHHSGRAVDFTIVGVPNDALRDYLLTMDKVGVGYYPNSTFVHLDVRDVKTHWIDYSGPGEAPALAPRSLAVENLRRAEPETRH